MPVTLDQMQHIIDKLKAELEQYKLMHKELRDEVLATSIEARKWKRLHDQIVRGYNDMCQIKMGLEKQLNERDKHEEGR